ncbi:MAG: hypothetical protein CME88_06040 [Hirschia sp.]|nr:hypothetical protein [Hirschia sp.]MBF17922.1 hypothetical protein [Hirschia sp.]|tara:strand:+ start:17 stop:739 length:723 start_codon:yes stop_codon:yes gene_type:complete
MPGNKPIHNKPQIVLVSHGDRGDASDDVLRDARLKSLQKQLQARFSECQLSAVTISDDGALSEALRANPHAIVVSLLFSKGYFFTQKIASIAAQASDSAIILSPFVENAALARLVADAAGGKDILLVGHGSGKSDASANATRALALLIEQVSSSNVICGFLEQSPYAVDLASQAQASGTKMHVMGLFLEAGLHGGEDFESITRAAGDACCGASIIGDHYGLADLLETEIKRSLEHWASVD